MRVRIPLSIVTGRRVDRMREVPLETVVDVWRRMERGQVPPRSARGADSANTVE